ncbi:dioxygenase family protein [Streptomyces albidoflavus]
MSAVPERPETPEPRGVSRKNLLRAALGAGALPLLTGGGVALARDTTGTGGPLDPTPACDDGDDPTPEQMEGPYFKPNSPLRTSLAEPGTPGTPLTVGGYVFDRGCRPLAGVLLDFWQADDGGAYDNAGFRFRGHQFTTAAGEFRLTTIVPGLYPGRTRHLHVKVQPPGGQVLTTQLYFPGEPRNATDALFDPALLMNVRDAGGGREATFDVVLAVGQGPGTTTWAAGRDYTTGDRVSYDGAGYRCLQSHRATAGWEPPRAPALWQRG